MRNTRCALLGLMVAFAALVFSGTTSQAAMVGDPGATRQAVETDALVQKAYYHGRHRNHWRWGGHGGHWRWGSHHHGRYRSHWRWGSRHYHSRYRSHWR